MRPQGSCDVYNIQAGLLPSDINPRCLKDPNFWLWSFKIVPCRNDSPHNWSLCPYAHPNEKGRRRDPRAYQYEPLPCPDDKKGIRCPRGEACNYTHNIYEYWCHPKRFRTQVCQLGTACTRPICFFAHTPEELRQAEPVSLAAARAAAPAATSKLFPREWPNGAQLGANVQQQVPGVVQGVGNAHIYQQQQQQTLQAPTPTQTQRGHQQVGAPVAVAHPDAALAALLLQQQLLLPQHQATWAGADLYTAELQQQQWAACQAEGDGRYVIVRPGVQPQLEQQQVQPVLHHQAKLAQLQLQQVQPAPPNVYAAVPHQPQQQQQAAQVAAATQVAIEQRRQLQLLQAQQQQQQQQAQNSALLTSKAVALPNASVAGDMTKPALTNLQLLVSPSALTVAAGGPATGAVAAVAAEGVTSPLGQLYSGQAAEQAGVLSVLDATGIVADSDAAQLLALEAAGAAMSDMTEPVSSTTNLILPSQQLMMVQSVTGNTTGAEISRQQQLYAPNMAGGSHSKSWAMSEQDVVVATAANSGMLPAGCRLVPVVTSSSNSSSWPLPGTGAPMSTASASLMSVGNMSAGTMASSSLGLVYVRAGSDSSSIGGLSMGSMGVAATGRGSSAAAAAAAASRWTIGRPPIQNGSVVQMALQHRNIARDDPYLYDL